MRIGQRPQEYGVDDAEDCGRQANTESQRRRDCDREAGVAAKTPDRVARVLPASIPPGPDPDVADVLFDSGDVAELLHGRGARGDFRHATLHVLARLGVDVLADLAVERVEIRAAGCHDVPVLGWRIRAIAPAILSHLPVSTASCRRPIAVRR